MKGGTTKGSMGKGMRMHEPESMRGGMMKGMEAMKGKGKASMTPPMMQGGMMKGEMNMMKGKAMGKGEAMTGMNMMTEMDMMKGKGKGNWAIQNALTESLLEALSRLFPSSSSSSSSGDNWSGNQP